MTTVEIENVKIRIAGVHLQGERRDDDFVRVEWFGQCPHTGAGLFLTLEKNTHLLPEETHLPWTVQLWPGHEDGEPAPPASSDCPRFATVKEARKALTAQYRAHLRR